MLAIGLAGCGGAVSLSSNFPAPMTQRLPLTAQIQYPDGFRDFSHVEEAMDSTRWTIAIGRPSMRMLNSVLGASLTLVAADPAGPAPDLIIQPEILRFEFGVPGRSKVDVPAAWIEFDLRITSADGAPLTTLKIPRLRRGSAEIRGPGREPGQEAGRGRRVRAPGRRRHFDAGNPAGCCYSCSTRERIMSTRNDAAGIIRLAAPAVLLSLVAGLAPARRICR